ncbi:MAG: hypothetical protein ACRCSL_04690 [Microbacterium sp.]
MHHKRRRPKNARAGCLHCKPHKMNGAKGPLRPQEQVALDKLEDGLWTFETFGGGGADPWGMRLCDDGSCDWCQRTDLEYRFEQMLGGELFEVLTPPLTFTLAHRTLSQRS